MSRRLFAVLSAVAFAAALGLSGCSDDEHDAASPETSPPPRLASLSPTVSATDRAAAAPRRVGRRAVPAGRPAVPGLQKLNLVEGATPENGAVFDQFANALVNGGYAPVKFDVRDIGWSDRDPADVVANVDVGSPDPHGPRFAFPMEFKPYQGGWQLSARTADVLLAFRNDSDRRPRRRRAADPAMWIGWLEFDLLLGDVHSLKQKRSVVRPIVAELQRKFGVSAAETGSHELHRRAGIGVAMASADRQHAVDVLDAAERLVAAHPEIELLSVRRDLQRSDDC